MIGKSKGKYKWWIKKMMTQKLPDFSSSHRSTRWTGTHGAMHSETGSETS